MDGTGESMELCVGRKLELPEFSTNHDLVESIVGCFHIQDEDTCIVLLIFVRLLYS